MMFRRISMTLATALCVSILAASPVSADPIVQYDLFGVAGDSDFAAPTFEVAGVTGLDMIRGAGLTPSGAGNSFSSSGWDDLAADDYVEFGFSIDDPLLFAEIDQLILATRASNTGPGLLNVEISIDGGAFTTLTTRAQSGTDFNNDIIMVGQTVFDSLLVRFRAANDTSAAGGTIGSGGTWRIGNQFDNGVFTPVSFMGALRVVPEPSSMVLVGLGSIALVGFARMRRRQAVHA